MRFRLGQGDSTRVNDCEWLVHGPTVREMLRSRGFRCALWKNFNDIACPTDDTCVSGAGLSGTEEVMRRDWEISGLFVGAVFFKDEQ